MSVIGHVLSRHMVPSLMSLWHSFLPTYFFCAFWALCFRCGCVEDPTVVLSFIISRGNSNILGSGQRSVSKMMFSLEIKSSLDCTLHFSHRKGGSDVRLSQKGSIPGVFCLLTAPCCISLKFYIFRRAKTHIQIELGFHQAKSLVNTELGLWSGVKEIKAADIEQTK